MLNVVSVNLDSLYLTVRGSLNSISPLLLQAAKEQAQDFDEQWTLLTSLDDVAGGPFYVERKGVRQYNWHMKNSRFSVQISNRGGCRPIMRIQVISSLLYEYDLEEINVMVSRICLFLAEDDFEIKVQRADLAVDFQSANWQYPDVSEVKTRARSSAIYREGAGISGMYWGRQSSPMQIVIYSKSETLEADNKEWMRDIWAKSGVYDADQPVKRIEFRFQRELLRELKCTDGNSLNDISDLLGSVGDLADYAISGEKPYFKVVEHEFGVNSVRKHVGHSERLKEAGWWSTLKTSFREALTRSQGRKRVTAEAKSLYQDAVKRGVQNLARAAAIAREQGWNRASHPGKFFQEVGLSYFVGDMMHWAELVNNQHRKLRTLIAPNPDHPPCQVERKKVDPINIGPRPRWDLQHDHHQLAELRRRLMSVRDERGILSVP